MNTLHFEVTLNGRTISLKSEHETLAEAEAEWDLMIAEEVGRNMWLIDVDGTILRTAR